MRRIVAITSGLTLLLFCGLGQAAPRKVTKATPNTIQVYGEAEVDAPSADTHSFTVSVGATDPDPRSAAKKAEQTTRTVTSSLEKIIGKSGTVRQLGRPNVSTSQQWDSTLQKSVYKGISIVSSLDVTVRTRSVSKLARLVAAAKTSLKFRIAKREIRRRRE